MKKEDRVEVGLSVHNGRIDLKENTIEKSQRGIAVVFQGR